MTQCSGALRGWAEAKAAGEGGGERTPHRGRLPPAPAGRKDAFRKELPLRADSGSLSGLRPVPPELNPQHPPSPAPGAPTLVEGVLLVEVEV